MIPILILIFLVPLGLVFLFLSRNNKRRSKFFAEFAANHDMGHAKEHKLLTTFNTVQGALDTHPLVFEERMEWISRKGNTIGTYAIFDQLPFDFNFEIRKSNLFGGSFSSLDGAEIVQTGIPGLDKNFIFHSDDVKRLRDLLNPRLEAALGQIKQDLRAPILVQDGKLTYHVSNHKLSTEKQFRSFEKVIEFMHLAISEQKKLLQGAPV